MNSDKVWIKRSKTVCKSCMERKPDKLLQCGHKVLCRQCLSDMIDKQDIKCPRCHKTWKTAEIALAESSSEADSKTAEIQKSIAQEPAEKCLEHQKDVALWCTECSTAACLRCVSTTHRGHSLNDLEESAAEVRDFVGVKSTGNVTSAKVVHLRIDRAVSHSENGIKEKKEKIRKMQMEVEEEEKKVTVLKNMKSQIGKIETRAEVIGQLVTTGNTDIVTKMALKITATLKDFEANKAASDKSLDEYWQEVVKKYKNDAEYQVIDFCRLLFYWQDLSKLG